MNVFLSYRTKASRLVRLIAAWLTYNGVRVWFAEERIGLDDQFRLDTIKESLRAAIRSCTHFLIFTNADYVASRWCRLEARLIQLRRKQGPISVVEICIPPCEIVHRQFRFLTADQIPKLTLEPDTLPDIGAIEACLRKSGWSLPPKMYGFETPQEVHNHAAVLQTPFGTSVPMQGWRCADEKPTLVRDFRKGRVEIQGFRRDHPTPMELGISFVQYHSPDVDRPSFQNSTDREIRDWAMKRVPEIFSEPIAQVKLHGIHLDFLADRAQLSVSYTRRKQHPQHGWVSCRKSWWCLSESRTSRNWEIVSTFSVYGGRTKLEMVTPLFEFHLRVLEAMLIPNPSLTPTATLTIPEIQPPLPQISEIGTLVGPEGALGPNEVGHGLQNVPAAIQQYYKTFQKYPVRPPFNLIFRMRQAVRWLTGYW